jgi:crotonobetainyl-CoA:carnitine CoA-transferase CaiB-like acyl-CoA transferase
VLENFRPGTMEKWGLGPDDVHARNPKAIYARVSGYGQTGRYTERPGFASAGEAISGLRYINGYPDQAPPRSGISLGDTLAAQSAFQGILLALYARDARGAAGQVVDASITDACFAMTESMVVEYEKTGFVRQPSGTRISRIAPSNVYRSKDGRWVVIAANHDTLWRRLAALMGRPELGEDERFSTHHARGDHEDELDELIGAWAAEHTAEELDRSVNEGGVVCAPVYSAADIAADPFFRERGLLVDHVDEVHGEMSAPGVVPKLSGTPGAIRQAARWTVGADTDAVLEELGVGAEERARLRDEGVL